MKSLHPHFAHLLKQEIINKKRQEILFKTLTIKYQNIQTT